METNLEKEVGVSSPVAGSENADMTPEIDVAKERALVRKIDWHLIPIIMVLYLFSFLDRGKLGSEVCWL